jgi:bis(5'-nucleosyl)-tetraphosphatase (symmetrical)
MAQWAIGDVQGCLNALQRLIAHIQTHDAQAQFYFCGDLVNRGEDSLGTLKLIQSLGNAAQTVLGNHDLFALACAAGFLIPKKSDTFHEMLAEPHTWVDWLRHQPIALDIEDTFLLTHAGVWHEWDTATTLRQAHAVEAALRADDWQQQLETLWQGGVRHWRHDLNALDQQRFTINALMRMRLIAPDGGLDFDIKESLDSTPIHYVPWFEKSSMAMQERVLVFGHWSALGLRNEARWIALDSGCVWGRQLSAVRLCLEPAARHVLQVSAANPSL